MNWGCLLLMLNKIKFEKLNGDLKLISTYYYGW